MGFIKSLWSKIKGFLNFFGLIDDLGCLSRTNLLVYIFTFKFAFVPMESAGIQEIAMALGAMGIYMGKKVVSAYEKKKSAPVTTSEDDSFYDNIGK